MVMVRARQGAGRTMAELTQYIYYEQRLKAEAEKELADIGVQIGSASL